MTYIAAGLFGAIVAAWVFALLILAGDPWPADHQLTDEPLTKEEL